MVNNNFDMGVFRTLSNILRWSILKESKFFLSQYTSKTYFSQTFTRYRSIFLRLGVEQKSNSFEPLTIFVESFIMDV